MVITKCLPLRFITLNSFTSLTYCMVQVASPGYRLGHSHPRQIAMTREHSLPATGKVIIPGQPAVSVLAYHHLGVAVTNVGQSCEFFSRIGFKKVSEPAGKEGVVVLQNPGGLYMHVFPADRSVEDGKNLLMDFPETKYPGHTHASFTVPSVSGAKAFLEGQGFAITGERKPMGVLRAVFIRDPDRTTFEFEKNVGEEADLPQGFTPEMIGNSRPMDHVGIRVRNPDDRLQWYAEKLGFTREVFKYEANPDPLKNERPWITTTPTDCDINFIINVNTDPAEPNRLTAGGEVRPGIVYVGFTVADVAAAAAALAAAGVATVADDQLTPAEWGLSPAKVAPAGGPSIFLRDPDGTLLRLVQA